MRRRTEVAVAELAVKGVALLVALAVAYWVLAWPWMLGSRRSIAFAWALELGYLLLVGDIVQFTWRARQARRAEAISALQSERERAAWEQTARAHAAQVQAQRDQHVRDMASRADAARRAQVERDRVAEAEERRRIERATPRWARLSTDPLGQQRWWDGAGWTNSIEWEFSAVRPDGNHFTHGACSVRHRTAATASQCRRG